MGHTVAAAVAAGGVHRRCGVHTGIDVHAGPVVHTGTMVYTGAVVHAGIVVYLYDHPSGDKEVRGGGANVSPERCH